MYANLLVRVENAGAADEQLELSACRVEIMGSEVRVTEDANEGGSYAVEGDERVFDANHDGPVTITANF